MNLIDMAKQIEGEFQLTALEPKDMTGRLKTAEAALTYITAGNAYITLRSADTGTRYTYRVTRAKNGIDRTSVHFVKVLTGQNNESDYRYFGFIKNGEFFFGGAKSKVARNAPSVAAFEWALEKLNQNVQLTKLEVWHDGRCGRCGRKLTVPESVERGIGPECALIMGQKVA